MIQISDIRPDVKFSIPSTRYMRPDIRVLLFGPWRISNLYYSQYTTVYLRQDIRYVCLVIRAWADIHPFL